MQSVSERWQAIMLSFFVICSLVAFYVVQRNDLLFIYDDGVSYLTIAHSVFDNIQPGIEQIGSIWLPLSHILKLPFAWNDFLIQSSLAGSILSMISYVAVCVFVYRIAFLFTLSKVRSTLAVLVCALNPALLFLQATAMSEVPFMAFFMASAYYFIRYIDSRAINYLAVAALLNSAMVLVRYEGWFVVFVQAMIVAWAELVNRTSLRQTVGRLFVFLVPVGLAVLSWLLWNYKLTGDPLYFVRGEFSASVFTDRQQSFGIRSEGSIVNSLLVYGAASVSLIGLPIIIVALSGQLEWVLNWTRGRAQAGKERLFGSDFKRTAAMIVLLSPALFHIVTMFFGYSIMRIAGVGGDTTSLNARYGIFLLPYVAVGIALVSRRLLAAIGLAVIVVTYGFMATSSLLIIDDAREGQIRYREAGIVLRNNVREDDRILVSMATNSALTFHSQLSLERFVHEGDQDEWDAALADPDEVEWVVRSRRQSFDSLSQLTDEQDLANFAVFYSNNDITLYRKQR